MTAPMTDPRASEMVASLTTTVLGWAEQYDRDQRYGIARSAREAGHPHRLAGRGDREADGICGSLKQEVEASPPPKPRSRRPWRTSGRRA